MHFQEELSFELNLHGLGFKSALSLKGHVKMQGIDSWILTCAHGLALLPLQPDISEVSDFRVSFKTLIK